jgi:HIV Tat-specific factor 1
MRKKSDKVIVIENVFDFKDFDRDAALILECSAKLREHCSKFGGVTKVVVYDKNQDGICQVFFKTPEEADLAISMLDGRLFSQARGPMKCYTWDGKTKYKVTESEEEEKVRLAKWEKFLKEEEEKQDEPTNKSS